MNTLINDGIFLGHSGYIGIGRNAEVAGWLWERAHNSTSADSNIYTETHSLKQQEKGLHHCRARELSHVAMVTLTAATASSKPRDPQLMMRVKTPNRHTLKDKQKQFFNVQIQLTNVEKELDLSNRSSFWGMM